MGGVERNYAEGDSVGPLVKEISQEAINLFEGSAGHSEASQFTDEEAARETLGTSGTVASGRMSISFALEMMRRNFGKDVFNRQRHGRPQIHTTGSAWGYHHVQRGSYRNVARGQRTEGEREDRGTEPARGHDWRGFGKHGGAQCLPAPGRISLFQYRTIILDCGIRIHLALWWYNKDGAS